MSLLLGKQPRYEVSCFQHSLGRKQRPSLSPAAMLCPAIPDVRLVAHFFPWQKQLPPSPLFRGLGTLSFTWTRDRGPYLALHLFLSASPRPGAGPCRGGWDIPSDRNCKGEKRLWSRRTVAKANRKGPVPILTELLEQRARNLAEHTAHHLTRNQGARGQCLARCHAWGTSAKAAPEET